MKRLINKVKNEYRIIKFEYFKNNNNMLLYLSYSIMS